jgi:hypothetical protein
MSSAIDLKMAIDKIEQLKPLGHYAELVKQYRKNHELDEEGSESGSEGSEEDSNPMDTNAQKDGSCLVGISEAIYSSSNRNSNG